MQHYLALQNGWIEVHKYFMGLETGRDITRTEAANDFFYGNDNYPDGEPSADFKHHFSPRGLTWENEYNIDYFNNSIIPALVRDILSPNSRAWVESKAADVHDRGLSMRTTHLVERVA